MIDSTYVAIIAGMAGQAMVTTFMAGKFKAVVESIQEWKGEVAPLISEIDKKIGAHESRLNTLEAEDWRRTHRTR